MLILGIDPGTATTGYGLVDVTEDNFKVIDWGLIETDKDGEPGARLIEIHEKMHAIIAAHKPDEIAIEKLFFFSNAKTVIRVGQAQGVMILTAAMSNTKIFEYAPANIKKMISGNGRADKKMMQQALRKILGAKVRSAKRKKTHFDNAADALAVALCHACHTNGYADLLNHGRL